METTESGGFALTVRPACAREAGRQADGGLGAGAVPSWGQPPGSGRGAALGRLRGH